MHVAQLPASHENGARSPARRAVSRKVSPAWYFTSVARPPRTIVTVSVPTASAGSTSGRRPGARSWRTLAANANRSTNTCSEAPRDNSSASSITSMNGAGTAEVEVGVELVAHELAHEVGVDEPLLGVEVVHDLEPVAVLRHQRVELGAEDHRSLVAVGVEQPHAAVGGGQRALDQRDHGGDAAATGERDDRRRVVAQREHARGERQRRARHLR